MFEGGCFFSGQSKNVEYIMNIIMDIIDIAPSVLKSGRRGAPGSVLASMLAGVLIRRQAKMFDVNIAYGARVARGAERISNPAR